jgi:hypothetical protein
MAQAVAAQALARASALLGDDPGLLDEARAAYRTIPGRLDRRSTAGIWIKLYSFDDAIVLNAQLQAILSLLEYSQTTGDADAGALAQELATSTQALFPRFDTGDWSRYQLGGPYATRDYQKFVTDLLAKLARQTQDPFWVTASQRFHSYYYDPPTVTQPSPPAEIWPQPLDGWFDTAQIPLNLSMRASLTVAIAGSVSTYRLAAGSRTITWKPPPGLAAGAYPVQVQATSYAGNRRAYALAPVVVHWETTPPALASVGFDGTTLTWAANDPGTPWLALAVDLVDPNGVNAPQTLDLGHQALTGSLVVALPPGTWQATLRAANSAALATAQPLGTFTRPG